MFRSWLIKKLIGKRFAVIANLDNKEPVTLYVPDDGRRHPILLMGGVSSAELTIDIPISQLGDDLGHRRPKH